MAMVGIPILTLLIVKYAEGEEKKKFVEKEEEFGKIVFIREDNISHKNATHRGIEEDVPNKTPESIEHYNGYVIEGYNKLGITEYRVLNPVGEDLGYKYMMRDYAVQDIEILEREAKF